MLNISERGLLSNIRLLLVEDEELARDELSRFLKRRVGKLYIAQNGLEGLEKIKEYDPDMIVTDLKMPNMDGLEMIRTARKNGYDGAVIIVSALSDSETILKAVDVGIVKYMVKPVDTEKLILTMGDLASNILKTKMNHTVIDDKLLIDKDAKREIEQKIRGEIAHFIKSCTGKGPRNVQVFIQGNIISVKAEGVLTLLESTLVSNNKNNSLVNYNRRLLYLENKRLIEKSIENIVETKVNLLEIEVDSCKNFDFVKFSFL
ncbi:response regulator [Gottschalkia purinilytica]|uniref:Response regulator n=1 Tax=Gottschalkia purinilytica TaxID=1503 RepID=A0A0L0W942_GOTPU|nr:Na-translocating system protein MpsC family protein [Gottschalkia purinilytica]KNF08073.1 response regulator [Gottschalkia purinilytica]